MSEERSGGRRRRRRTRHHPVRRRRRRIAYLLGGLLLLGVIAGALLYRDAIRTRDALTVARERVDDAQTVLGEGEVEHAQAHLQEASDQISTAQSLTGRILWRAGAKVPVLGRSLGNVSAVVDVAGAATRIGREVVDRAGGFVGPGGQLDVQVSGGKVELQPIRLAADAFGDLDVGSLRDATGRLGDRSTYLVPQQIVDARSDALELAHRTLSTVERAGGLLTVLPGFLGGDGPRRYFLAMQNNAELRGTGGLIGFWAVLTVDDGEFSISEPQVYNVLDRDPDEPEEDLTPVETSVEFHSRYQQANAAGFFANVNVDPDLPTTSPVLLDLYAQRTARQLDGVVAMDPVGLSHVLGPIGPVDLPDQLVPTGLPDPVPPAEIPQVTMVDLYRAFEDDNAGRKVYLQAFALEAFDQVFGGGWDAVEVGRQLSRAAGRGHLQLYSEIQDEQEAFVSLGLAGAMAPDGRDDVDLIGVTANNAAGNKLDVHVGHTMSGEVRLEQDGSSWQRDASIRVVVDNPMPDDGWPLYVIGSCPPTFSQPDCYSGPTGLNRTWFTVWGPASSDVVGARDASGSDLLMGIGEIHGEQAADHYLETSPESTNHFEVDLAGPVELSSDGRDAVYRLRLWRQAKAIPDRVDLTIHAPEGMRVVDASVTGGGDGSGMGPFGEPGPEVAVETFPQDVNITGDVTADLDIEVRFAPPPDPWWKRLRDWLNEPAF